MDIRDLARRHHTHSAHKADAPQVAAETATVEGAQSAAPAAASGESSGSDDAATTHRVSGGGRFMHMLQAFEDRHPEEAKRILNNIADKLRADAEHAGPWASRLERWADKVQKAADTGDMSNLLPTRGHSHFGVRAYQKAQESSEAGALDEVAAAAQGSVSTTPVAAEVPAAAEAASETSAVSEGTPIIPSTPAATSGSADATTPIIPGTASAVAETKA